MTQRRLARTLPSGRKRILLPQADPSGAVRVGPVSPLVGILREYGVDLAPVLLHLNLDAHLLDKPDNWLPFRQLGRLLEESALLTGCPHIGLLIGQRFSTDLFGVLGRLICNAPTLRDALRMGAVHLAANDRGAISLTLDLGDKFSALGYALFQGSLPAADQILDGAIAMQCVLLRRLAGSEWRPRLVQLSHKRPRNVAPFRQHFGSAIEFNTRLSAIVFESRWLDQAIAGADPAVFKATLEQITSHESTREASFVDEVRRAIYSMSVHGTANAASLARLFNVHPRTLRRRLGDMRTTCRELLGEVRSELAQHLLRDTDIPVSEIAWFIGYSDPTVFARAFRGWSEESPSQWRTRHSRAAASGIR